MIIIIIIFFFFFCRQGLLADKMMLGVGETTSASDLFHTRLLAIHKELGDLLQSIGTHKITYMVRHDNIHVHVKT